MPHIFSNAMLFTQAACALSHSNLAFSFLWAAAWGLAVIHIITHIWKQGIYMHCLEYLKSQFLSQIQSQPLPSIIHLYTWWFANVLLNIQGQICFASTIAWLISFITSATKNPSMQWWIWWSEWWGSAYVCAQLPKLPLLLQQLSLSHETFAFFLWESFFSEDSFTRNCR